MVKYRRVAMDKQAIALQSVELLGHLAELFALRRKQLAESVGLTDQQWQVLEEVQEAHFMPSMFARQRESSPAAVSKMLRQLTNKGLVTAEVSSSDARQRNYSLTTEGKRVMSSLRRERQLAIENVWLHFTKEQLTAFNHFGEELVERLDAIASEARSHD